MANTSYLTPLGGYSDAGVIMLRNMANGAKLLTEFLRFQGRVFKHRTVDDCTLLNANYAKNNEEFEQAVKKYAEKLQRRDSSVLGVLEDLPESFPKALRPVIDWTELTQAKFAEKADIPKRTVERMLAGVVDRPSQQIFMRICIGVGLPVELSLLLLERSGNSLRNTAQEIAYMKLLFFAGYYSIDQCNKLLEYQGIHTI